ncbi:unnamed protein product [Knipowitschia caucasica]|uniref:Cystatin domain-containing protein n=2 Tax=Knipowitschia caucasica TaxID=637954 RepID=A0AAV2JQ11_KNICA
MKMLLLFSVCLWVSSMVSSAEAYGQIMTGHPRDVSVHNSKVMRAAQFAVKDLNQANSQQPFSYQITNVTSAKVQVVAGINYIMEMQLRPVCKSRSPRKCHKRAQLKELRCSFVVTEIPWEHKRFVYRRSCKHKPQKHF